jgi:hypothetical protein
MRATVFRAEDVSRLIPLRSEVFEFLVDSFYIVGADPWETDESARFLCSINLLSVYTSFEPLSAQTAVST